MAYHVDILKTEPTSIAEKPLVRVIFDNGHVDFDGPDAEYWQQLLCGIVQIDPVTEPDRFFEALPSRVEGTYIYATEPHDEANCPVPGALGDSQLHPAGA